MLFEENVFHEDTSLFILEEDISLHYLTGQELGMLKGNLD